MCGCDGVLKKLEKASEWVNTKRWNDRLLPDTTKREILLLFPLMCLCGTLPLVSKKYTIKGVDVVGKCCVQAKSKVCVVFMSYRLHIRIGKSCF